MLLRPTESCSIVTPFIAGGGGGGGARQARRRQAAWRAWRRQLGGDGGRRIDVRGRRAAARQRGGGGGRGRHSGDARRDREGAEVCQPEGLARPQEPASNCGALERHRTFVFPQIRAGTFALNRIFRRIPNANFDAVTTMTKSHPDCQSIP
jgi:hypothetical protein